jgi:hypothetical protein
MPKNRLTKFHISYEPGDQIPPREELETLYEQRHVVDVLRWILESDAWLRTCELTIVYESYWVKPQDSVFNWKHQPSTDIKECARQSVYKILPKLFDSLRHPDSRTMPIVSQKLIKQLNAVKWNQDQAIATLAPLVPGMRKAEEALDWLIRHKTDWEASYLDKNVSSASNMREQERPRL